MWSVHRVVGFSREEREAGPCVRNGFAFLGLHERGGGYFALGPEHDCLFCVDAGTGEISWSLGPRTKQCGPSSITADLKRPSWISSFGDGTFLVCNSGRGTIIRVDPECGSAEPFIDLRPHGISAPANCVLDAKRNIWVNDPGQARLWVFTRRGELLRVLGSRGEDDPEGRIPAPPECPLEDMRLAEVYDIRSATDGMIYILEGSRFRVRAIDFERNTAKLVAGTGVPGSTGDGGDPAKATFGGRRSGRFDGPWAFCLDDRNALYIADTQNGAVRMIDGERRRISTIAGGRRAGPGERNNPLETDPLRLSLKSIIWMDWGEGMLFVSDETGDLVVLKPEAD